MSTHFLLFVYKMYSNCLCLLGLSGEWKVVSLWDSKHFRSPRPSTAALRRLPQSCVLPAAVPVGRGNRLEGDGLARPPVEPLAEPVQGRLGERGLGRRWRAEAQGLLDR